MRESPVEWANYVNRFDVGLEIIPYVLYDTKFFISGETTELAFFNGPIRGHRSHTNMWLGNILPNPQAFLIENIRINGVSSAIQFGFCRLQIGCKEYGVRPAWAHAMKEKGYRVNPALMIAPLQIFDFRMEWEGTSELGAGASGLPIHARPVQVCFFGKLARPIQ